MLLSRDTADPPQADCPPWLVMSRPAPKNLQEKLDDLQLTVLRNALVCSSRNTGPGWKPGVLPPGSLASRLFVWTMIGLYCGREKARTLIFESVILDFAITTRRSEIRTWKISQRRLNCALYVASNCKI